MKQLIVVAIMVALVACQENDSAKSEFTGNEITYPLQAGSSYPVNGHVTFKEKLDGSAVIRVELSGTAGDILHPVHLHIGNISSPDADVAALLNPVDGNHGISETTISHLADESQITYTGLLELNACIKVHLSASGPEKNIILAGGNIGVASADNSTGGRSGFAVCKSE